MEWNVGWLLTIFNGICIAAIANGSATSIRMAIHLPLTNAINGRCAAGSRSPSITAATTIRCR